MLAGFCKSGPSLVHYVVVGKGDDLDSVGLERIRQCNRSVEHEWLGPVGMRRRNRRLEVHKTEIGVLEDVPDIAEERTPTLGLGRFPVSGSRGGGSPHRLMRNYVSGDRKPDLGYLVRLRRDQRCHSAGVERGDQESA